MDTSDPVQMTERFFTVLKSLNDFDKAELRGIVQTLLNPTPRDICVTGNYYRGVTNIESLLSLKSVRDFQAISMIVRSLFEIAVDVRLINQIGDSVNKMIAYSEVEKLRSAKKILAFKAANPDSTLDVSIYEQFTGDNGQRIDAKRRALWPGIKNSDLLHWSSLRLPARVALLKAPFEQIYAVNYPQLSWYAHSGLTGVLSLEKETFRFVAAVAFTVAMESYVTLLAAVIDEFKIGKANQKIKDMMLLAKLLPFTDGAVGEGQLRRALLG